MNLVDFKKKKLENWFLDSQNVADLRNARDLLKRCKILELLPLLNTPNSSDGGESLTLAASDAHWFRGFVAALNQLEYFEAVYVEAPGARSLASPDFGGKEIALKRGYVTAEEIK